MQTYLFDRGLLPSFILNVFITCWPRAREGTRVAVETGTDDPPYTWCEYIDVQLTRGVLLGSLCQGTVLGMQPSALGHMSSAELAAVLERGLGAPSLGQRQRVAAALVTYRTSAIRAELARRNRVVMLRHLTRRAAARDRRRSGKMLALISTC